MSVEPATLPFFEVFVLLLVSSSLIAAVAALLRTRRDARAAKARQAELERALEERSLHLKEAVEAAEAASLRLRDLEMHDGLTGVFNRAAFLEAYRVEWRRCRRDKMPLSVVFLVVDGFERFDRTFASDAGDDCLRRVAAVVSTGLYRAGDLVGRWGEDRFVLALPATDSRGAAAVASRLEADVETMAIPSGAQGSESTITLNAGIATVIPADGDHASLLAAGETALESAPRRPPPQTHEPQKERQATGPKSAPGEDGPRFQE